MKSEDINLKKELANCKTMDDLCGKNGLLQRLLGNIGECQATCRLKFFV